MELRCAYCRLELGLDHFLVGQSIMMSICDICQQRGLQPGLFGNQQIELFAQARQWQFLGLPVEVLNKTPKVALSLSKQEHRQCQSLIRGYDALSAAWQVPKRRQKFYQAVIMWQNNRQRAQLTDNLPVDLAKLGCPIVGEFDRNNLDYPTRQAIRERYHHICQYCGRYGDSVDHKEPVTNSNDNELENLTLSCRECNRLKGQMPFVQFSQWNQETGILLPQLVLAEQTLQYLQDQQQKTQRKLAVQRHLTDAIVNEIMTALRWEIKLRQGLIDGQKSDYQVLIKLRHDYIVSHYQVWLQQQGIK